MEYNSISSAAFAEDYQKAADKVGKALRDYLGDPNETNTRVLRAAVRRQSTVIGLVPKPSRRRNMKLARVRSRKVLKATSSVRDLDIVRDRITKLSADETVLLLLNNLEEERGEYVADSMKAAWKLFELHDGKASARDFRGVARWVRKELEELDSTTEKEIDLVAKNEGKVDELHSLRKHCKRFRYALELLPQTRATEKTVRLLRSWQDILGEIRDADVVIEYLGRARQVAAVRRALEEERSLRHRRYRAFVRSHANEFKGSPSLLRLAGLKR